MRFTSSPTRSIRPRRLHAPPPKPSYGRDGLARRGQRRHRRRDAAQPRTSSISARAPASAAAPSRTPRNLYQEFGAGPDGRHADLRTRLYRRGARRLGDGRALHRGPDVRRLPVRGGRPDRRCRRRSCATCRTARCRRRWSSASAPARCARPGRTTPAPTTRSGRISRASSSAFPSTPADAKGLMKTALRAADPVMMLEIEGAVRRRRGRCRTASISSRSASHGSPAQGRTSPSPAPDSSC